MGPVLLSADCVIADQGSMSLYAAALDVPLLFAGGRPPTTVSSSPVAELAARAPHVGAPENLREQILSTIAEHQPGKYGDLAARTFEKPGSSAARLRKLLYGLMDLVEPAGPATLGTGELPVVLKGQVAAFLVTAVAGDGVLSIHREPVSPVAAGRARHPDQHLVAHALDAAAELLQVADVVYTTGNAGHSCPDESLHWAAMMFKQWPRIAVAVRLVSADRCIAVTRDGIATVVASGRGDTVRPGFDPLLLASAAYVGHLAVRPGLVRWCSTWPVRPGRSPSPTSPTTVPSRTVGDQPAEPTAVGSGSLSGSNTATTASWSLNGRASTRR